MLNDNLESCMLMNVEKDLTDSVTVDEDKQYSTKDFSVYAKLLKV